MKNVVLLAPYFLPRRRVGSWRPFKFAIHLKEYGWEPHIITIQESTGKLTPKEESLLSDIPLHTLKPPFDFTQQSGSSMAPQNATKGKKDSQAIFQPVLNWVDKNFPIDTWLPLFMLRKRKVEQIIDEIKPEVLWSTGDPWSSHWLARKMAYKKNMPWVADFRDPWTLGGVNLKKRSSWSGSIDQKEERKVVKQASVLTFTSQRTEELYKNHYKDLDPQTATVYNCFDLDLYDPPGQEEALFDSNKLNLLFFGKFRRLSPARPLIDILALLSKESEQPIRIHSFGALTEQDRSYAVKKGVIHYFNILAPIPAEEALSVLPQADVLWLSTELHRKNIIPAKLWDYLAARRPVISIAPNPEIANILDLTGAGIQLDHTQTTALADLLKQSILAKQQGKPLPIPAVFNEEVIKQYEAKEVTRKLAAIFDQLA